MSQYLWGAEFGEFWVLIRSCCEDSSDEHFQKFWLAWREFLNADLTQFISDAHVLDEVCWAAKAEYHREFRAGYRAHFDYGLHFRAIAYSHLSHMQKDRGIQSLLEELSREMVLESVDHDRCVLMFAVILRITNGCAAYLLDVCFELAHLARDEQDCVQRLREALNHVGC